LERIICRALRAKPHDRYRTAIEMLEDLMSDLGDYDISLPTVPERSATEDPEGWEKFLRRALGDDYELLDELGSGGFGRVYHVRDLALEREVALKVLHPYLTIDPAVVERFQREARTAAMLSHMNIVNTFDIGGRAGLQWYTMEYVRGRSLDRIVAQDGPLPLDQVIRLLFESLDALSLAHSKNIVHRDLKPENLLVEAETGAVRIADFGLAVALGGGDHGGMPQMLTGRSGTPAFAAPEQMLGETVDHRADLYSLTLSAYYALSGKVPFGSGNLESIVAQQAAGRLPKLADYRSDIPVRLMKVLEKGAARDPDGRFADAKEYSAALTESTGRSRSFFSRLLGGDRQA
jgi:serine/threonine-protein kinase